MLYLMNRRSPFRSLSCAILCGVVAFSVTGLPLSHHADHDGEVAHVEHGHGGHGTVLLEQDERLLSKTFDFHAVITPIALPFTEPAAIVESPVLGSSFAHPGRDPPEESRPRAPPILIS
jgi:hypothetical protein